MQKVTVNFKNCYGIRDLEHVFDFSGGRVFAIYAPNGVMKTSFAKSFHDHSQSVQPIDRIHRNKISSCSIVDASAKDLDPESIFVVEPYNQAFKSAKISTLLVNKQLKDEYDKINEDIDAKKTALLKEIQKLSGVKKGTDEAIADAFTRDKKEFFSALIRVQQEVTDDKFSYLSEIKHNDIFDEKILAVLSSPEFRASLASYIGTYDDLLSKSNFFSKGVFNHNNASDIAKYLKENGFFKAKHSVFVNIGGEKKEIKNEAELEQVIQQEKDQILKDPKLVTFFDEIDKKLIKNASLKDFRDLLEGKKFLLPELENLESLNQKLWISYLSKSLSQYKDLLSLYNQSKETIEGIIKKARAESTKWQAVIEIFNDRFTVPFKVKMRNQAGIILNEEAPSIQFDFLDHNNPAVPVEENTLLTVLSNGEKRALYILNIIFEVEARKESGQESLFIIDDIADSFDYKNKYAIIEYLKDISKNPNFYQIILSHNFDFFRTVCGRLIPLRKNKLHTVKLDDKIKLVEEKYQKNPFDTWKNNLASDQDMLIASIPFLRNIAEYCGKNDIFNALTGILHVKSNITNSMMISDLERFINRMIDPATLDLPNKPSLVKGIIYNRADVILLDNSESMDLEKKIVLSIAIRLKAEEFMIMQINDQAFVDGITSNQTYELTQKYISLFRNETAKIKVLDQVNLMTPENIHLNSFMYEPILDMSNHHLKELYRKVGLLTQ